MFKKGDILYSKWGYWLEVVEKNGEMYGSLICESTHSCYDIPYSIEPAEDYILYWSK